MNTAPLRFVISCEHASRWLPPEWRPLFPDRTLLASHAAWDAGAAQVATALANHLDAPLLQAEVSRLLVDCNRSPGHPKLHGAPVRNLPARARQQLVDRWHRPYRERVTQSVAQMLAGPAPVLHISCHSFTPIWNGVARPMDIGLLYDPQHGQERQLALQWQASLRTTTGLRVQRNAPYRGTSDGLTRTLRRRFGARYSGLELELNQRWLDADGRFPESLVCALVNGIPRSLP